MKTCSWCGKKYPDEAAVCAVDGTPLDLAREGVAADSGLSTVKNEGLDSEQEERFWAQMNFKRFAALMLRIQALWLLFYAVIDATYLLPYLKLIGAERFSSNLVSELGSDFFLQVMRIGLHVAVAVLVIRNAERFLSWLVKDWVSNASSKNKTEPRP